MKKNKLLLVAILAASVILPAAVWADRIQVQIGDRAFFNHGERYWAGDYEMVWVSGHWSGHNHHWVHGHYVRTELRRHELNRHRDVRFDGDRHDDASR
jgi:hypothetical protein